MFLDHFQSAEQPLGLRRTRAFFSISASQREALASLYCGYVANRGFTALIAEPGMGKTTLLFEFLRKIKDRARTAFLFNTLCDANDLISGVLRDLGVEPSTRASDWYCQLNMLLATEARAGRRVVLVVDEAQNLSAEALEAIRLLTNFETPTTKLMQIVLAGQPQLAETLAKPAMAQLLQRISTVCRNYAVFSNRGGCLY
jgi:general secretion pathway protein A